MNLTDIDEKIIQFIEENQGADSYSLSLKLKSFSREERKFIADQVKARNKAAGKVPSFLKVRGLIFPPPVSVEQASSEISARYKAKLAKGPVLVDMTGGLGVDAFYFAQKVDRVIYIEKNNQLAERARYNFRKLGSDNIEVVHADSVAYLEHLKGKVDTIYVDPSRRKRGERFFKLEDSAPDIIRISSLLLTKSRQLLVKTSPFLDILYLTKQFSDLNEIHILAIGQECKEILLRLSDKKAGDEPRIITWTKDGQKEQLYSAYLKDNKTPCFFSDPMKFIYDPNASIRKAGLFNSLCSDYGIGKLSPNSHLFTGDSCIDDFPGRAYQVEQVYRARDFYKKKPLEKGNILIRNSPEDIAHIRSKAGIREGDDPYIFATRDKDKQFIFLITSRIQ